MSAANLLIISCSKRKRLDPGLMPAFERYDGVAFRMLKKLEREQKLVKRPALAIVSAKYGLLQPDEPIVYYDCKLEGLDVMRLYRVVQRQLPELMGDAYERIFINLGKQYLAALGDFQAFLSADTKVSYAQGGIGERLVQMKTWLSEVGAIEV